MAEYDDPYAVSGQFIDIMIAGWWEHFGAAVAEAVRAMPADEAPLLDAGAGGGWGTRLLATAHPTARVVAVEPSPVLRAVLLSRIAADDDLRSRVTVDGDDLLSARLPDRLAGVVAANLIGHFSPEERGRLWGDLAGRLVPGGSVLVNLAPPLEPARVERAQMSRVEVGTRTYLGWAEAEPAGEQRITWHMTYEVHEGDRLLTRDEVHYGWWTLTEQQLVAETATHGLATLLHGPTESGLYTVTPKD
ncbi:class I SAM-dependent methyltransferase [Streptomonospora sp. S1-112]|uniref:Class I SAM-dependent methyltransferase n=1 Tax=Streptomonospora mangrovi TaxID=2883123 RepID=A0A9X3NNW0_9ACTN|nr:class I SAM-dependent methyltransferase [Streptomonospora mangrovi]MDA0567184.1 class I SAM-dependent methyltransferase [Streptomonospora mangrovi]